MIFMDSIRIKNIANFRAIPQDRYARRFLDYSLESLSSVLSYRRNFIFYRSILAGLSADPVFGTAFPSMKDDFVKENKLADAVFLDPSSQVDVYSHVSLELLSRFVHDCIEKTATLNFYTKQYVICRCLVVGLSCDKLFCRKFESLKKGYMRDVVAKEGSDYGAVNFITEILGKF